MRIEKPNRNSHSPGMTLIEIMIVMAIIAMIMGLGASILLPGDDAKLREEANRLEGTIKFIYNEAAIKNKFYRLAFNLDENSYRVESSTEPFYVQIEGEEDSLKKKSTLEEKGEGEGEEAEGASPQAVPAFAEEEHYLLEPVKFPKGIKIKDLMVLHSPDRHESGEVFVYFLPTGWAEPMIINFSDDEEEVFYSLEVNPLTGKSKIRGEYREATPEILKGKEAEVF